MRWTVVSVVAMVVLAVGCDDGAGAPTPTPSAADPIADAPAQPPPQPQETVPPTDDIATVMPSFGPTPTPTATPSRELPHLLGTFDVDLAPEVSGIARSRLGDQPGLLWIVDDGPGTDRVRVLTLDGDLFTTVVMEGVEGRDTEAIAVGPCGADQPGSCVYVGDIGDNTASRDAVRVHRFAEEAGLATAPDGGPVPVETITLTHPDGPVDAESMVVDAAGRVIILTKRDGAADIHVADTFTDGVLRDAGELALPDPAEPLQSLVTGVVATDAALLPDGTALLVRTYDSLLRFTADGEDAPTPVPGQGVEDLAGWAVEEVEAAPQVQSEAVTFWLDAHSWVTAGEGSGELWLAGGP